MIKRFTFRYWKGPLHYMDIETDEEVTKLTKILYGDHPETEMIFICGIKGKVMELRNEGDQLSLNALTATMHDYDHIDMLVRGIGENGTIDTPLIGFILQRLKTKHISKKEARKIAKEWVHLNPYVRKYLVEYGLLDRKTLQTCSESAEEN